MVATKAAWRGAAIRFVQALIRFAARLLAKYASVFIFENMSCKLYF
jgi:hypothetical protein